jgi:hypothetical protein
MNNPLPLAGFLIGRKTLSQEISFQYEVHQGKEGYLQKPTHMNNPLPLA